MLVKYLVRKSKYHPDVVMVGHDFKTIKKSELSSYQKNGWEFVEERYFLFSYFKDWFNKQSLADKLAVLTFIATLIFGVMQLF